MSTHGKGMTRLKSVGLVASGILAGAVIAGVGVANAANTTTTPSAGSSTVTTTPPIAPSGQAPRAFDHGGATPVRSDEKSVSSADSATLTAAALKAVPGAAVYRVETDAGDAAYEVHLTKSDGTLATVKFDSNLTVTKVESGMGQGDPAPQGQPGTGQTG
jgi:hypothetical protein